MTDIDRLLHLVELGDVDAATSLLTHAKRREDRSAFVKAIAVLARHGIRSWTHSVDGSTMVNIPAGRFLYGRPTYPRGKTRNLKVGNLPDFALAMHPVTNAQFLTFLSETGYTPSPMHPNNDAFLAHWNAPDKPPKKLLQHPVVHISLHDAMAYCDWAGLQLPTTWMWSKAGRGTDGRGYPWGNRPKASSKLCSMGVKTKAVGTYPKTRTAYGCQDMAGNIGELCLKTDTDAPGGPIHVPKVGSAEPISLRALRIIPNRTWTFFTELGYQQDIAANYRGPKVGFRPALYDA